MNINNNYLLLTEQIEMLKKQIAKLQKELLRLERIRQNNMSNGRYRSSNNVKLYY